MRNCMIIARCELLASAAFAILSYGLAAPAAAQQADAQAAEAAGADDVGSGDIIVTARKRSETAIDVPVALTALGKADLERYSTRDLSGLSAQVPGLIIQPIPGGGGGSISLRGITSSPTNPAIDQAISFNVDGVQVGSGNIMRLGQIDLQQIEILKGPQALFFGKNSPGGIISMRSVDPGRRWEGSAIAGYELKAREKTIQLGVGGPVSDTLGIRLVGYAMDMEGYRRNRSPVLLSPTTPGGTYAFAPRHRREPNRNEQFVRATIVYTPTPDLSFRAKYNFGRLTGSGPYATSERIACPYGAPQVSAPAAAVDDCKIDGTAYQGASDPRATQLFPDIYTHSDGLLSRQHLGSLEGNYDLADGVTFTSVTGFYKLNEDFHSQANYSPVSTLIAGTETSRKEISQEVRVATDRDDWPVNFTVGGYYQDVKFFNSIPILINNPLAGTATLSNFSEFYISTKAHSVFGQALWKMTPTLELAVGLRWSREKKHLDFFQTTGAPGALTRVEIMTAKPDLTFTDKSPEVTLTWTPAPDLTIFGGFRNGFKSGGFNTGSGGGPGVDVTYRPEDARGFELGLKTIVGGLRFNATAYRYIYKNLQVSTFDPIFLRQTVLNAASAKVQGIEIDASFRPRIIEGLELRGGLNYNHGRYREFLAGCYTGQTVAEGCNVAPIIGAGTPASPFRFSRQDLAGAQLNLAPDWTGSAGFTFSSFAGSGLKYGISGDAIYSSSFWSQLEEAPIGRQNGYWTISASARIGADDNRWELALIGQNLTQVYRSRFTSQVPQTGIAARTGTATTGGLSDYSGQINRGREIRLQATTKF